jgi:predicted RNA polymerase sigma factor
MPDEEDHAARLAAVLRVLYLIFNEGYTASSGPSLVRADLSGEAIRLTRQLHARMPSDGEAAGLLALMILTDARRPARIGADGSLIPLAEEDRELWDRAAIAEGTALIERALSEAFIGPYQLQAAIAAIHDQARRPGDTDWRQILALYEWLDRLAPGPMVTLNRIIATAMVDGPAVGLARLDELEQDDAVAAHHRVAAVRAHLLEMIGDPAATAAYRDAARRTLSLPEKRYLEARATGSESLGARSESLAGVAPVTAPSAATRPP